MVTRVEADHSKREIKRVLVFALFSFRFSFNEKEIE